MRFSWEASHLAAILETDDRHLAERIRTAEDMLSARLIALKEPERHIVELRAIENALKELNIMRRERLHHA